MKLEIKHLAPYLLHKLKLLDISDNSIIELNAIYDNGYILNWKTGEMSLTFIKPILRPLSDITKEIEHNGLKLVPIEHFEIGDIYTESVDYGRGNVKLIGLLKDMAKLNFIDIDYMNFGVMGRLFEWHFDVFGLIEKGLAVDINDLDYKL